MEIFIFWGERSFIVKNQKGENYLFVDISYNFFTLNRRAGFARFIQQNNREEFNWKATRLYSTSTAEAQVDKVMAQILLPKFKIHFPGEGEKLSSLI